MRRLRKSKTGKGTRQDHASFPLRGIERLSRWPVPRKSPLRKNPNCLLAYTMSHFIFDIANTSQVTIQTSGKTKYIKLELFECWRVTFLVIATASGRSVVRDSLDVKYVLYIYLKDCTPHHVTLSAIREVRGCLRVTTKRQGRGATTKIRKQRGHHGKNSKNDQVRTGQIWN